MLLFGSSSACTNVNDFTGLLVVVGHFHFDIHDKDVRKYWSQNYGPGADTWVKNGIGPLEVFAQTACWQPSRSC